MLQGDNAVATEARVRPESLGALEAKAAMMRAGDAAAPAAPAPSILPPLPSVPGVPNTQPIYEPASSTIAAGSYLYYSAQFGGTLFPWGAPGDTLINAGTIYMDDADGFYGQLMLAPSNELTSFSNSGTLVMHTDNSSISSVRTFWEIRNVTNSGEIFLVSDKASASFIQSYYATATFVNSGLVAVSAPDSTANAVIYGNGGTVNNQAGGRILVEGHGALAIGMGASAIDPAGGPTNPVEVTNAGWIEARATSADLPSIAISLAYGEVVNSGTIVADIAVEMNGTLTNSGTIVGAVIADTLFTFENLATGTMTGTLLGGDNVDVIHNAGLIAGNASLGRGDDVFINSGSGRITGVVDLGFGADQYTGSDGVDRVAGDNGNDIIDGGGGNDLLLGGNGDDRLIGGAGNDGLYGEAGNDTIVTLGGDRVDGGSGDDRVELGDYSFLSAAGGAGTDTLVLASGAIVFDLSAALATGRISGFEIVEMRAGQGLVVRAADVAGIGAGSALRIDGDASDTVTLVGGWTAGADLMIGGNSYHQWTLDGATVNVRATATVSVAGSAPVGATGLAAVAAGETALAPGAAAGLDFTPQQLIVSYLEILENETIEAEETWYATGSTPAVYAWRDSAHLTVNGALFATNEDGAIVRAVDFTNFSRVENHGIISAASYGALEHPTPDYFPYSDGAIAIGGGLELKNSGIVDAYSVNGVAVGTGRIQIIPATAAIGMMPGIPESYSLQSSVLWVTNSGTIQAWSDHSFALGAGSFQVTNSGTISAHGERGAIGVIAASFVHNLAGSTISAQSAAGTIETAILVNYGGDATEITNAGTISGRMAIDVTNGQRGISLNNSGLIQGGVQLSAYVDIVTNSSTIDGEIHLGAGNDRFDGHAGNQHLGVWGDAGDDTIIGGAGADLFDGGDGDDVLDGGAGADRLIGGKGNDTYYVDQQGDLLFEKAGEGTDSVFASASFYLYANVENLTLVAGSAAQYGVGNELANIITGNGQDNLLIGGAGDDTLYGGAGADWIYGEADNDVLWGGTGIDYLIGGDGNDVLHGEDGAGEQDFLYGGAGNDTYYVDAQNDLTFEDLNGGTDTVYANIAGGTYYLFANVENLVLQGTTLYGVGNELNNSITGSDATNWLLGGAGNDRIDGGKGNDVLYGEAGADTFVFGASSGIDTIGDFTPGTDKIDLSAYGFANFAAVQAAMTDQGGGIMNIALGSGNYIILIGVAKAQLTSGDFILSSTAQEGVKADVQAPETSISTSTKSAPVMAVDGGGKSDAQQIILSDALADTLAAENSGASATAGPAAQFKTAHDASDGFDFHHHVYAPFEGNPFHFA